MSRFVYSHDFKSYKFDISTYIKKLYKNKKITEYQRNVTKVTREIVTVGYKTYLRSCVLLEPPLR